MLEIRALDAFYGDSHILHGVNLHAESKARVSVLGRNGAGKTTLMKSVVNAGPRVGGDIRLDGRDLGSLASFQRARLGMALVPEDRRVFPHLSVVDNLLIARAAESERGGIDVERVFEAFPMLQSLKTRFGNQLSGGQQQMVAVARGIVPRPRFLLLDEPTEGLAPVIVKQLARSVVEICDEFGIGLLLSEQNIWFARRCTEHLYIVENGRVAFSGSWPDFDAQPEVKQRYLSV